jgi:UPF0755 protein
VSDIFDLGLSHQPSKPPIYRRLLQLPAVALSILVFVAIAVGGVSVAGKYLKPVASNDYTGDGTGVVQIEVRPGDTSSDIAKTLVAAGVVKSTTAFVDAAQGNPKSRDIQPGTYQLRLGMSAQSALALLVDPSALIGGRLTIPEGTKLAKLEGIIASKTKISASDVEKVIASPAALGLPAYANGKVEGFLFPATYTVTSSTTATSLLTQMVAQFKQVSNSIGLEAGAAKLHMTPYQVLTVASLIEAEVKRPQDYAQVAEVIDNRLRKGMKLELDSTVNYALGTSKQFLSQSDLKVESAYNTYLHAGLPPTPIDSPGRAALEAALNPATGNLLYFVTMDPSTGETIFTDSQKQFEQLRAQAQARATSTTSPAAGATSPAGSTTP